MSKENLHSRDRKNTRSDRSLGLDCDITRRDFLNSTLLASGGLLLNAASPAQLLAKRAEEKPVPGDDWTGYGGIGDYANSNGNTMSVMDTGHRIRNGEFESVPADVVDTGETYDCIVVGGGISGLAAALIFRQLTDNAQSCLVIDNHPIFGGEAKRNEFEVDGQRLIAHQGSAFFPVPYPHSFIARFYDSIGLKAPRLEYQKWGGPDAEMKLSTTPYLGSAPNGTYFGSKYSKPEGAWIIGDKVWERAPIPPKAREELIKYDAASNSEAAAPRYPGDAISRRLDSITLEDYMIERSGISRETIREFLCPGEGGGYGLGPDALSGYTAYAADMLHPLDISDETGQQMFPGGNGGIARLITKTLIPDAIGGDRSLNDVCRNPVNFSAVDRAGAPVRIRLDSTAVWVKHESDPVKSEFVIIIYSRGGKTYRVKARSVVMAGGSWTTKHIVRDLPSDLADAYGQFYRAPCMMANVAVRNWRFLYKMGISGCRWYGGLGEYTQVRKLALCGAASPTISPDSPVVLTLKILYAHPGKPTEQQGHMGRAELLSIPFREYERRIREQFDEMFARSGFDPARDVAGIILNRWGHAYLTPPPGFFFGKSGKPAPGDVLRAGPFGRIAFANTDLSGVADHRSSIIEANRAVVQLLDQVLS
ncbi:MAG TPA: FAD/NAD(P)-binding protein [Candidatus Sulfotelmatobacter sp.]|nr:FAD/NAD(P)-binding protein [Candidatus Sulfotelmatobacter sp.]